MIGKANKANPRMAMEALHRANGDRQKAWSEYIRLHYQSTGSLSPGCNANDLYTCLDAQTLELWRTAKAVVDANREADIEVDGYICRAIPVTVWQALEVLV